MSSTRGLTITAIERDLWTPGRLHVRARDADGALWTLSATVDEARGLMPGDVLALTVAPVVDTAGALEATR